MINPYAAMSEYLNRLPEWIMAFAALWGVAEIVRGYFKLKKQERESQQKLEYFDRQLNELKRQTTQFEYQTKLMNENNKIMEHGIDNLTKILLSGLDSEEKKAEIEEQKLAIEEKKRMSEIQPFFEFENGVTHPQISGFTITLRNDGGTAINLRLECENDKDIVVFPLELNMRKKNKQKFEIKGRAKGKKNVNAATGEIKLEYEDIEGNPYKQIITKQGHAYRVGIPEAVEN